SIFPHFGHRFHASSVLFLISSIIPLNPYFGHSRRGGEESLFSGPERKFKNPHTKLPQDMV
ncbi:hypothetical protein, partial [uncultured Intestinimonas sp.]|uniref:hypothetical protein n=1 Tax=uncultured Intestinimonas sp. TaxID=1689265 RepID=UPI0025EE832B